MTNKANLNQKSRKSRWVLDTHQRKDLLRWSFNFYHLCLQYKGTHAYKRTLLKLKSHIDPHKFIVGDFITPLSPVNKSTRQKLNGEILELIDNMTQTDLTYICRTFHLNTNTPHRTFSKFDNILRHKASLNRYNEMQIISCILSDYHRLKLDFNSKRKSEQLSTE